MQIREETSMSGGLPQDTCSYLLMVQYPGAVRNSPV